MDKKLALYNGLNKFLETKPWDVFRDDRFIAVEIPKSKEIYYVTVNFIEDETLDLDINIMKGDLGLYYLRERLDPKSEPFDELRRSHFVSITFEKDLEQFPEDFYLSFDDQSGKIYEKLGQPFIFYKAKGFVSQPIDDTIASDLRFVFEALTEQPVKKLKNLKTINKNTTFETLFKKEGQWQRENRKVKMAYEKVKYSDLEIYPLMKKTKSIDEVWYITSIYEETIIEDEELMATVGAPAFEASVHILDSQGQPMNGMRFTRGLNEIPTVKSTIVDSLRTYEVRPTKIITNLRNVYYGMKDFLKALNIESDYAPENLLIEVFVDSFLDFEDDEIFEENEIFAQLAMVHFFKEKGITEEDLDEMSEAAVETLMDEFNDIVSGLMDEIDQQLMKREDLDELPEEEITDLIIDFVIKGIEEKTKA